MAREKVNTFKYVHKMNKLLRGNGILLVSQGRGGKPNAMTIGWGFLGTIWGKPVCVVAVRKSRYTHGLMGESKDFTVCLPGKGMAKVLDYIGNNSGRDHDKIKEMNLSVVKGISVSTPYFEECPVHIECTTVFKTEMAPGQLDAAIEKEVYKTPDYHTIYFGEVKGVYATGDAALKLPRG
jgi:flavin reductase (DIM6/NTAB) family NADH-FMN oxidoreductase RutF